MAVGARPLSAHPLPLEVVVYLKAESGVIRAAVHMPAAFLADARLPRREDGYLDLGQIDGPMSGVASYVARTLDLAIDGRSLPAPSATWALSRQADVSGGDFQAAFARASAPRPAADARVNPDTMAVDFGFEYTLPPGVDRDGHLSLRVNDFRAGYQNAQMRVVDVSESGSSRTLVTRGTPRRIDLNPGRLDVLALFSRRGLDHLRLSGEIVLFLLCLAIPMRPLNDTIANFIAFAAACFIALAVASMTSAAAGWPAPFLRAGAGAMLVVAALQNITDARTAWARVVAASFGLFEGLILGAAYTPDAPLAGMHGVAALVSYAAPIVAGALLLLLVARALVDLTHRTRLQERWAVLLLSAIPIHSGLHGVLGILQS